MSVVEKDYVYSILVKKVKIVVMVRVITHPESAFLKNKHASTMEKAGF